MLDTIRGLVRPLVTIAGFGTLIAMIILKVQVPDWFQVMVGMMISYWFASRKTTNG